MIVINGGGAECDTDTDGGGQPGVAELLDPDFDIAPDAAAVDLDPDFDIAPDLAVVDLALQPAPDAAAVDLALQPAPDSVVDLAPDPAPDSAVDLTPHPAPDSDSNTLMLVLCQHQGLDPIGGPSTPTPHHYPAA